MKLFTSLLDMALGFPGLLESGKVKMQLFLKSLVWLLAGVAIVSALVLMSAGFILLGLYQYLILYLPLSATALILSMTALVLAGLAAGLCKWQAGIKHRHY